LAIVVVTLSCESAANKAGRTRATIQIEMHRIVSTALDRLSESNRPESAIEELLLAQKTNHPYVCSVYNVPYCFNPNKQAWLSLGEQKERVLLIVCPRKHVSPERGVYLATNSWGECVECDNLPDWAVEEEK